MSVTEASGGARSATAPRLNAICPYFTMFPYSFPERVLAGFDRPPRLVLDPFCGRGTTNIAARAHGYATVGVDSNLLAIALTAAKLVDTNPDRIMDELRELERHPAEADTPASDFWHWAFAPGTLRRLSSLRAKLTLPTDNPERIALRALIAGALHGPVNKGRPSYLSNQAPRTFAPKPGYALKFWRRRDLPPREVDLADVIGRRATWYYSTPLPNVKSATVLGDARNLAADWPHESVDAIITSPPYWQMRTYRPDQWLRLWFLGGPDDVEYSDAAILGSGNARFFAEELKTVWRQTASVSSDNAVMVVRFGAIPSAQVDAEELFRSSLAGSGWTIVDTTNAGDPRKGKRQSEHFGSRNSRPVEEIDFYCRRG
jgi:hypothetical protein